MKEDLVKIIRGLSESVNVVTGELYDKKILSDDPEISKAITVLALSTQKT